MQIIAFFFFITQIWGNLGCNITCSLKYHNSKCSLIQYILYFTSQMFWCQLSRASTLTLLFSNTLILLYAHTRTHTPCVCVCVCAPCKDKNISRYLVSRRGTHPNPWLTISVGGDSFNLTQYFLGISQCTGVCIHSYTCTYSDNSSEDKRSCLCIFHFRIATEEIWW